MRQVFLDTETTGLSPQNGDRVIEIGCVELCNRKPTGNNRHFYLNPGRDSHEEAFKVHGLSTEFLRDKPTFEAVADDLLEYLQDCELVIHNAEFDVGFLDMELALLGRASLRDFVVRIIDSLTLARDLYPGKRNSLDALCERLGIDNSARTLHGAMLDAALLAEVYIHLTRGQKALLIDAGAADTVQTRVATVDLSTLELPVLLANAQETAAHEEVLTQIDKASKGRTVWRLAP